MAPPRSWDEFEDITCSAAKNRWQTPNFTRHGRQGQRQDGVDIYGNNEEGDLIGIQCKNTWDGLRLETIEAEVQKASSFNPPLAQLFVATTANTDQSLQAAVRLLSMDRIAHNQFSVSILFWNDVWQDLTRDTSRLFQHYPELKPSSAGPSHDQRLFNEFQEIFPFEPTVRLLQEHDFGSSFSRQAVSPLNDFYETWDQPEKEFLDPELQAELRTLFLAAQKMADLLAAKTVPVGDQTFLSVYPDSLRNRGSRPDFVREDARTLNEEAHRFVPVYTAFIRLCKKKLEY